jgi:hypothetical protein
MVQPKTPPLSIRPGEARLSRIDAYAAEHRLSRHLAILLMLDEGYRSLTGRPVSTRPARPTVSPAEPLARPPVPYGSRLKKR